VHVDGLFVGNHHFPIHGAIDSLREVLRGLPA